jgi:hypothetical protein
VHSDVIRLIAFDFVLWIILARVMDIAFVFHVFGVHPHDFAPDPAGFRIPAHMRADFEPLGHPWDHGEHPAPKNGAGETQRCRQNIEAMRTFPANTCSALALAAWRFELAGQTGVIGRPKTACPPGYTPYYDG